MSQFAIQNPKTGEIEILYEPTERQAEFHACTQPNVLYIGSRNTGKSLALRMEAHMRALAYPGFPYAIIRRTHPELLKSHLNFIDAEMEKLGGFYHKTDHQAIYPNGSKGFYSHCNDDSDVGNLLSAEFYWMGLDELSTIPWETFRKLAASVRVPKKSGLIAMVRGTTNPLGISMEELNRYFITKDIDPLIDPDYIPSDWHYVKTTLKDNPHINEEDYRKQFAGLPVHVRKAWLDGEFVIEGAYFVVDPSIHFTTSYPNLSGAYIYRAMDFGIHDETVCLWIAVYPSGRAIVFKERSWTHTTVKEIAAVIKQESQGMRILETMCDPTMFAGSEVTGSSIGDVFEQNWIPLTRSRNDRTAAGYSISEWLNTMITCRCKPFVHGEPSNVVYPCHTCGADGKPKLQIYSPWCPMLVKTLPEMRVDPKNPGRLADGRDHWCISLSYFCMAATVAPRIIQPKPEYSHLQELIKQAQRQAPGTGSRQVLGNESVRRRR